MRALLIYIFIEVALSKPQLDMTRQESTSSPGSMNNNLFVIGFFVVAALLLLLILAFIVILWRKKKSKRQSKVPGQQLQRNLQEGNDILELKSENLLSKDFASLRSESPGQLAAAVSDSLVGGSKIVFTGPFGKRPITYCDYIASGRAVTFIEDFVREKVLPFYANTHTTTTVTALQTTLFRDESREILRDALNASEDDDAVIFTGSGCTGAVHKLIGAISPTLKEKKVVVFVSVMEHHSNLLPWRELLNAQVVIITEDQYGRLNIQELRTHLESHSKDPDNILIGCFCAASNITGVLNDDLTITATLHEFGAWAFWDYAAAAPYVNIDVNPGDQFNKDAVYFSMHKFVGGVQTPGILVAKKKLFGNQVPHACGGGTVVFVTESGHQYIKNIEHREEGGTPAIVESIRAGLAMQLKMSVSTEYIMSRESILMSKARARLNSLQNVRLLGNMDLPRLPVLSIIIEHEETGGFLHHNFVCALLNDLFGIQARGGCACAGPYAENLLGMDKDLVKQYTDILSPEGEPVEVMKPGFARLNLSWFASDEEIDFVLEAVAIIAIHGWKLMPQYGFDWASGKWTHIDAKARGYKEQEQLENVVFNHGQFGFMHKDNNEDDTALSHKEIMMEAQKAVRNAKKVAKKILIADDRITFQKRDLSSLRHFLLPYEARRVLCFNEKFNLNPPFKIKDYDRIRTESVSVGTMHGSTSKQFLSSSWSHSTLDLNMDDLNEFAFNKPKPPNQKKMNPMKNGSSIGFPHHPMPKYKDVFYTTNWGGRQAF